MEKCLIKIMNHSIYKLPSYQTPGSAGMDLYTNINQPCLIKPLERKLIPTGLSISMPIGYEAQIRARSGLALKHGLALVNGVGTIDSDYRGEIKIILINLGDKDYTIQPGERIAQMVIKKYVYGEWDVVEDLDDTLRGKGGFGHSGV